MRHQSLPSQIRVSISKKQSVTAGKAAAEILPIGDDIDGAVSSVPKRFGIKARLGKRPLVFACRTRSSVHEHHPIADYLFEGTRLRDPRVIGGLPSSLLHINPGGTGTQQVA